MMRAIQEWIIRYLLQGVWEIKLASFFKKKKMKVWGDYFIKNIAVTNYFSNILRLSSLRIQGSGTFSP